MKKRIASLFLVLAMALTLLPTAVMAEENSDVDTWDGTADTNWYDESKSEFHLKTAEQLAGLAKLVNTENESVSFAGKTIYLDNDLDLAGHEWISIGSEVGTNKKNITWYYRFNGTFDGKGHVIYNLYSHDSLLDNDECFDGNIATSHGRDVYKTGLFGYLYKGTIKNLGIKNADIWIDPNDVSTYGEGILVDYIEDSTIENCWTTGSITGGSYFEKQIGGIVGTVFGSCSVSSCYSLATITGNYNGDGYLDSDQFTPMDLYDSLGGIVGASTFGGSISVNDCWFGGKIIVNSIQALAGGIIGAAISADIQNCMVTTTDIASDDGSNTCWLAYTMDGTVENNYWPLDTGKKYDPSPLEEITEGAVKTEDQGSAVSDFISEDVLTGLKTNAETGITWVAGIKHPTFAWDDNNIPANYDAVNEAIKAAKELDKTQYSNYNAVEDAINAVDWEKSKAEQSEVDAMAKDIEDAIAALELKPTPRPSRPSSPSYGVSAPATDNGTVSVSPKNASAGTTVTVTVQPDSGYVLGGLRVTDKSGDDVKLTDQGNGKYTFTMPAGGAEVSADFVKETKENPFTDVPSGAYYYDAVLWAVENGVTDGVTATLFAPDAACTRAQIVTFLWRAAGSPEPNGTSAFTDVPAGAYYAKAVAWAVENGITTGTSDTTFSPDAPCTRGQSMTFLYRARKGAANASTGFTDVPAGAYYAAPVAWAVENGITNGTGTATFSPDAPCTRAEIVTFLYRAK